MHEWLLMIYEKNCEILYLLVDYVHGVITFSYIKVNEDWAGARAKD
jgi:hypothetical protein